MKKRMTKLLIFLFVSFCALKPAEAQNLTYDDTVNKAITNSFDLKISKIDINISRAGIKEARSEYYPVVRLSTNSEYGHDLGHNSGITAVGTSVVNNTTRFQNLASMGVSYSAIDYGVRGKKLFIAKKELSQKELQYSQTLRDLKLNLVELYTKVLLTYREAELRKQMLPVYKQMFENKQRLFEAGKNSKLDIMDEAIKIARTQDSIVSLKTRLKASLTDLSVYTGETYNTDDLNVADLDNEIVPVSNLVLRVEKEGTKEWSPEQTPEYKVYDLEIQKKQAELSVLKRQRLPKIDFYSYYNIYGSDKTNILSSFDDMRQRSISVGFSSSFFIFEGFKNKSQRERASYEIQKLQMERDKALNDIKGRYNKLADAKGSYDREVSAKQESLSKVKEKMAALERLNEQQLIDKNSILEQKADLLSQQIELERSIINSKAIMKQLDIMADNTYYITEGKK